MNMQTNQEIFFVAEPESNKIYKFDLVSMQFEFAKHFSKFVIKYCSKQFTIEAHSYISMDQSWLKLVTFLYNMVLSFRMSVQ